MKKHKFFSIEKKVVKLGIVRKNSNILNFKYDTDGQIRTSSQVQYAQAILFVFNILDEESFKDLVNWKSEVDKLTSGNYFPILVGNQIGFSSQRKVSFQEAKKFADLWSK